MTASEVWPRSRAESLVELADVAELAPVPRAAPGTYPIPPGRGRWRLTIHRRDFSGGQTLYQTSLAALPSGSSRVLTQAWDSAAQLDFTLDGRTQEAALLNELQQDVVAWRWDDTTGVDVPMFRGVISQSADTITEENHTVAVTAHDYVAMFSRRLFVNQVVYSTPADQDDVVNSIVNLASFVSTGGSPPTSLVPGSRLPLQLAMVNPDGSARTQKSGQMILPTFNASTDLLTALDAQAKVVNGFDYDVQPAALGSPLDNLRIWYPYQGIQRTDITFMLGATVASLTRTVDSSTYGNYWRAVGNNGQSTTTAPQLVAEAWNEDANNVAANNLGLWMSADNTPSLATQAAVNAQAAGDLSRWGTVIPSYVLTLTPGAYHYGAPNIGDVVPLRATSGRLNVNTWIRVLGLTFTIGDDGQEDVAVTVGLPGRTLVQMLQESKQDINALAQR